MGWFAMESRNSIICRGDTLFCFWSLYKLGYRDPHLAYTFAVNQYLFLVLQWSCHPKSAFCHIWYSVYILINCIPQLKPLKVNVGSIVCGILLLKFFQNFWRTKMADTMYALSFFNLWKHPPPPLLQREVEGGKISISMATEVRWSYLLVIVLTQKMGDRGREGDSQINPHFNLWQLHHRVA